MLSYAFNNSHFCPLFVLLKQLMVYKEILFSYKISGIKITNLLPFE